MLMVVDVLMEIRLIERVKLPKHSGAVNGAFNSFLQCFNQEQFFKGTIFEQISMEEGSLKLIWMLLFEFF
jgi:hypothetical protein